MRKALTAAGVIVLGAFVIFGILLYKVGETWRICTDADVIKEIVD